MHVEVKAHCDELEKECKGKHLDTNASKNSIMNHEQIGSAISQAKIEISKTISSIAISRDNCYQLSNRIAHAWWLANQVVPVVLLYLGFLNFEEMNYGNNRLFHSDIDWKDTFMGHLKKVGATGLLDKRIQCVKSSFTIICRSY